MEKEFKLIESKRIHPFTKDPVTNLALDSILKSKKQVLIFNNSKRSSESTAEKIANSIKDEDVEFKEDLIKLSNKILKTFSTPTKQCIRLAKCVEKGIGFHHSGLVSKQREIIEKGFKEGFIKLISSTPTLAAGLNLPAYKVIIKDYKRYSQRGFNDIPILEYHQMSGRAGRPGKEDIGRAVICINNNSNFNNEKERIISRYIFGKPEEIISKLAVEPTLKMYVLSLISMDLINTKNEIKEFFKNTLYAKQYQDLEALFHNIFRIIDILIDYNFIDQDDDYYKATKLGKKISELYLNPDTANYFIEHIENFFKEFSKIEISRYNIFSLTHFLTLTLEMKPLFRVGKIEEEKYVSKIENIQDFVEIKFDPFESDYENYLNSVKTTDIFIDWINEAPEDFIVEKYKITPGELNYKLETIDWLLYSLGEISLVKKNIFFKNQINKLRIRFKKGIKSELINLVSIKGIGRVRARKLFNAGFKSLKDLKLANEDELKKILPESLINRIREDLSSGFQDISLIINRNKPKEIKNREVSEVEIIDLVENYNKFEKEKEEVQKSLDKYFKI